MEKTLSTHKIFWKEETSAPDSPVVSEQEGRIGLKKRILSNLQSF